ncbi:MAG TPA: ATP-dependent DNA helicase RecG [Vitreimonas sp.]|nr:ATP-dependent DNA helicase RecG [Vitreimonas sp.]
MYTFETPLTQVTGIGTKLATELSKKNIFTVKDLVLFVPLRYEDKSHLVEIDTAPINELITLQAQVVTTSNYYKGPRSIQSATISDGTGKLKVMWFNNRFILDKLKRGESYFFSGKINTYKTLVQPAVEDVKAETLHTNRLVPLYSSVLNFKQGSIRRILKHILDGLNIADTEVEAALQNLALTHFPQLAPTLKQLHFPDSENTIAPARERLALEELLGLMKKSFAIKETWKQDKHAPAITVKLGERVIPASVPFELTAAQYRVVGEIMADIAQTTPMNRLLVGDVGSGKTVVAGVAGLHTLQAGYNVGLVAPTRILAEQHAETLTKLFPNLNIELVLAARKISANSKKVAAPTATTPTFYVGTHALINRFPQLKPGLIIYDEQHRFGVAQRSAADQLLQPHPHILTMSATPIPRSLMLTIFSHLSLSVIDEMPRGRQPIKTWVVPESKRTSSYQWMATEIQQQHSQVLVVCPFIDPSHSQALENVAAVTERFEAIKTFFAHQDKAVRVELLHGRMSKATQSEITERLYQRQIDVLVTTPIVEVGVDLPAASVIVIEAAERFGLASLHQLRGRVGRAGQQGYCLLFSTSKSESAQERLQKFCTTTNGAELAELDLHNRGAGDIFGTQQHGFEQLQFASWTNAELIAQARQVFEYVNQQPTWQPLLLTTESDDQAPLAN